MGSGRHFTPGAFGVLVLSLFMGRMLYSPCMRRLFRNAALPGIPDPVAPVYPSCTDEELVKHVSLVVTVKDTCGQANMMLDHLAKMFPKDMAFFYAYPSIRGCRHVKVQEMGNKLFNNFTEVVVGNHDAPIAGFLKVQKMLKTKYAVLMHNDAYPMERDFVCEMYRALEAHPEYPIAAPQIYERANDNIIVPHGHHQNLHVRPSSSGKGLRIDYDLSMALLTQRKPEDFKEGPQVDFLEDHAFFARADRYHELLDPSGSFTMEYMDMILNMRARNTSAWYVPTARCIFEVDIGLITWEDVPYLAYKRSEQIGHQVKTYLTNKWGVEFPNTGIWNYVRYFNLADVLFRDSAIPSEWEDQAALFYSWFESVGFNRYNGQFLPEFVEKAPAGVVNVSRSTQLELPTEVPAERVPPKSALEILPRQERKKAFAPEIQFKEPHFPIAVRKSSCDAKDPSSYAQCGMAVQEGEECMCWNYVVPFNLRTTLYLDKLLAFLKLPSRAFTYAQMKYWSVPIDPSSVDWFCSSNQEHCSFQVRFTEKSKVLQWSWFGEQDKGSFTPEGIAIGSVLVLLLLGPVLITTSGVQRWFGVKKQQLRSLIGLNQAVCKSAVRS